jgi:hypothetical protein
MLCFWTLSIVLSLSKNTVLFIFQNISETGFCLRLQVKPIDTVRELCQETKGTSNYTYGSFNDALNISDVDLYTTPPYAFMA